MNELGNPFTETITDFFTLDTKVLIAEEVIKKYVKSRGNRKKTNTIFVDLQFLKMEKLFLRIIFNYSKMKSKLSSMKNILQLFSRMYIFCQATNGDINVFFQHSWPPSLSINNMMQLGDKVGLLSSCNH